MSKLTTSLLHWMISTLPLVNLSCLQEAYHRLIRNLVCNECPCSQVVQAPDQWTGNFFFVVLCPQKPKTVQALK